MRKQAGDYPMSAGSGFLPQTDGSLATKSTFTRMNNSNPETANKE